MNAVKENTINWLMSKWIKVENPLKLLDDFPRGEVEKNIPNISISEAAKEMGKSQSFVRIGLQRGTLPFGTAEKLSSKYTYYISPKKFYDYIGKEVPMKYQ